jgi:hypothetical protein
MRSIAIIGTRDPSSLQAQIAKHAAEELSKTFRIRTGGADGIDTIAMENSIPANLDVFLPWASYNRGKVPAGCNIIVYNPNKDHNWTRSVRQFHPAPNNLTRGAIALHARNYGIVAEANIVLALPGPSGQGGTGQGIRVAKGMGITVVEVWKNHTASVSSVMEDLNRLLS